MAIRIDENTIFEDGRKKKISEANAEPKAKAKTEAEPKGKAETEEEPKTGKVSEKAEPKTSSKGKEARA